MNETFTGRVDFRADSGELRIVLNPDTAKLLVGGEGRSALVLLLPESADASRDPDGQETIRINAQYGMLRLGGNSAEGTLRLYTAAVSGDETKKPAKATIELSGESGNIRAGGPGRDGDLSLFSSATPVDNAGRVGHAVIRLNGNSAALRAGGNSTTGDIALITSGRTGGNLSSADADVHLDAAPARCRLGGVNARGDLALFQSGTDSENLDDDRYAEIHLDASQGRLRLGGATTNGDLALYPATASNASLDDDDSAAIHLRGADGDIRFGNADLAEEFDCTDGRLIALGNLVRLDRQGRVAISDTDLDSRLVGIVSGAGEYRPGLILDHRARRGRVPIAMVGKVFCNADASLGAIQVGDLLTSSATPGHARRVDPEQARPGAIIGKALASLADGRGQIPVLVQLQ